MVARAPLVIGPNGVAVMPPGDTLPTSVIPSDIVLPGAAGVNAPSGTTAQREVTPTIGRYRFNTTLARHECFTSSGWVKMNASIIAAYRGNVGVSTGTTKIAYGAAAPLITDGTQLWTQTVTPSVVGSIMSIDFSCFVDTSGSSSAVTIALFRGNTLIAWRSGAASNTTGAKGNTLSMLANDTTTSLTPIVYSVRVGIDVSGTWSVGRGNTVTMGGNNISGWKIDEVLP